MCVCTLLRWMYIFFMLLLCAHGRLFKKTEPIPHTQSSAHKKPKSFRAQILSALDLDPATPRHESESKECQKIGCLYGNIRSGHCFKCVKEIASRVDTSCRMPKRANSLLLKQKFVGSFIELVRATPNDLSVDESTGTVELQNLLGNANYETIKKCQHHHRAVDTGDALADTYIEFQLMIGGYASYEGLAANSLKSARAQPFQLRWGDFWKKRQCISELGEREAESLTTVGVGDQETSTLTFPNDHHGLVKQFDDTSFGFIFGRYRKTLKEIVNDLNSIQSESQLYSISPPLVETETIQGKHVAPVAPLAILEVTRPGVENPEKEIEAVKVFLHTLRKSACLFVTCRKEMRSVADPILAWKEAAIATNEFQKLIKSHIKKRIMTLSADKRAKWAVEEHYAWRQRFADQIKKLLESARIIDEAEQRRQDRVGKLSGLKDTCKNAAVKSMAAFEKEVNHQKTIALKRINEASAKKKESDRMKWFDVKLREAARQLPEDQLVLMYA